MNKLEDHELLILAAIANPHSEWIAVGDLSDRLTYRSEVSVAAVAKLIAIGFVVVRDEHYCVPDDKFYDLCDALGKFKLPLRWGRLYYLPVLGMPFDGNISDCFVPAPGYPTGTFRYVGPSDDSAPPVYRLGKALRAAIIED